MDRVRQMFRTHPAPASDAGEEAFAFVQKAKFGLVVDIITGQLRLIRTLRGLTPDFSSFDDAHFDESSFEQHLERDPRLAIATCWYWIRKLQARFFAGDYLAAIDASSSGSHSSAARLRWSPAPELARARPSSSRPRAYLAPTGAR